MIIDIVPTLQLHAYSTLASLRLTIWTSNLHSPEQKLLLRSSLPKRVRFAPTTTDTPPPRHPAALRVTNCLIDRYPMAAVDSGATYNFFPENYNSTAPNSKGPKISVLCANNSTMISTATDALALTKLPPPAARECYKFPKESIATPLMSVRKLDKANLRTTFENDQVTVTNKKAQLSCMD
jgi:hypothetical protein